MSEVSGQMVGSAIKGERRRQREEVSADLGDFHRTKGTTQYIASLLGLLLVFSHVFMFSCFHVFMFSCVCVCI